MAANDVNRDIFMESFEKIMKLALAFLAVLPLILASTVEEKRFLNFPPLTSLVDQLKTVVHNGMRHDECVAACTAIAGLLAPLCGNACTM
ncbi:hypothetical protein CHS0354_012972 [Potamilus streckersoni]|uniref:Uncharacterized protein n=1 Tax=Potamilus streckersoni TaxID=2493646 RepID=A0AAE0RQJ1_9BIVA|nr:hypothetical protein CHS0354_012972 [Potamilus streckersoni]